MCFLSARPVFGPRPTPGKGQLSSLHNAGGRARAVLEKTTLHPTVTTSSGVGRTHALLERQQQQTVTGTKKEEELDDMVPSRTLFLLFISSFIILVFLLYWYYYQHTTVVVRIVPGIYMMMVVLLASIQQQRVGDASYITRLVGGEWPASRRIPISIYIVVPWLLLVIERYICVNRPLAVCSTVVVV